MKNINKTQLIQIICGGCGFIVGLILSIVGFVNYTATDKLNPQDPFFPFILIGLFALSIGFAVCLNGFLNSKSEDTPKLSTREKTILLAQAALFAALAYVLFLPSFRIDIPVGPSKTTFHLGNTMVVLGALIMGGPWGGLAGAVGLSLADLMDPVYITSAPKTFILKLFIGLISGFVAHFIFKINKVTDKKKLTIATFVSAACGLVFNAFADPLFGYVYKRFLFGMPADAVKAITAMSFVTSSVNAAVSIVAASLLYLAIRPALIKAGLFYKK